jgi:benzodiazapine receptor
MLHKRYFSLVGWVTILIVIGAVIGSVTQTGVNTWYPTLNRSPFSPPNFIFPIVWTFLYAGLGMCGWMLWQAKDESSKWIKSLFIFQLILNWSWSPLFFGAHMVGFSLMVLILMDVVVGIILYQAYPKFKKVAWLMVPYFLWLLFASYLNFYIWVYTSSV